jgi:transcription-repair coupling factor (superfamily II helicase)
MSDQTDLVARLLAEVAENGVIFAASSENQARRVAAAARALTPDVVLLPGWDCLPFDRISPSRAVMGARMAAVRHMASGGRLLVVAPVETLAQRLPPQVEPVRLEVGSSLDADDFAAALNRLGYAIEDNADQPGEASLHGEVFDLFPADADEAVRLRLDGGRVSQINATDSRTRRSGRKLDHVEIGAASEVVGDAREPGMEHRLPEYAGLSSVFDLLPGARLLLDADAAERMNARLAELATAERTRIASERSTAEGPPPPGLHLSAAQWEAHHRDAVTLPALPDEADDTPPAPLPRRPRDAFELFETQLRPGDAVIHLDHGLARLDGIETVEAGTPSDCLVLGFAGEARKLVPCAEMDRIWRYGAGTEGVGLDQADGSTWERRRAGVATELMETARRLVALADAREQASADRLRPSRRAMARFVAGFPFSATPDQQEVFDAIAADLARGRPMQRVLVGDVGFGKTEAALRAAAAVALCGRQVAILAPTTVLVRQHLATFQRRFAALGITVGGLSRLTSAADARRVRAGLADGSLLVVVGTHALAAAEFANLALVVIDEEQRFGTRHKATLAQLSTGMHLLSMTATPIPRTLEAALAGVLDLSVLTTPPARRLPVRTVVEPFDAAVLRAALLREHARGGQSFVICPRIADLDELGPLLERVVGELSVVVLHGRMKPAEMDAAMVAFASGEGDVLLATNIVEAGLDIPRANTMLVWNAQDFGLAQLHQLRGRVGRGATRAAIWLFTDPTDPPTGAAEARLAALAENSALGSGFAVAGRDLDLRGGGELLGDEQAGHAGQLGVALTRHMLLRELAAARGGAIPPDWTPELALNVAAYLPEDYMPDPAARIEVHARIARDRLRGLHAELTDRFGNPPEPVETLLELASLRIVCHRLGVARLEAGPGAVAADMRADPDDMPGLERKGRRLLLRVASPSASARLAAARSLIELLEPAMAEAAE